ncbi:PREDICTED: protein MCM10 homolog [Camelina sativa]|uniref:Protein MCM10 homolog n=1 Tax=Camelina sativa TaxID=90675 RepID=A0ABM0TNM6_CAMSA|nr:PREDICTED: protein MCM10 homolog [Camelina sativa]
MGSHHQEDLDLLLSLDDDRVLETPPGSPSSAAAAAPGYLTDDESPKRRGHSDLSDFKSVVQDCIDYHPKPKNTKPKVSSNNSIANDIDKFSGLRIRNQLLSPAEISDHFSDIRFVRLPTIKNLLMGDKLSGCWATIGVLTEKGQPKKSSIGQPYGIWKIGSLTDNTVSLFLFGDAFKNNQTEKAGTVFGLFNCSVRKDKVGCEFSLSVNSAKQMVKLGVSADYGVCTAKRKDGTTCTSVVNKRQGAFCKIHKLNASDKFATMRTELKGGNMRTAFRDPKSQGIYTVEPPADRTGNKKATHPVRVLTVEGLRKALSGADKVTPNVHSQGIRFLNEMARQTASKNVNKKSEVSTSTEKRKGSTKETQVKGEPKRKKIEHRREKPEISTGKMMVLDFCSSDEE